MNRYKEIAHEETDCEPPIRIIAKLRALEMEIGKGLDEPIKKHCVAATCDLWSDDLVKRSYLDFTVFWIDEENQLRYC